MWRAETVIVKRAQMKNRVRSRRISWGSLAEPLLTAKTTAMLSHRQQILCPAQ